MSFLFVYQSLLEGRGVFAEKFIPKNTVILDFEGPIRTEKETLGRLDENHHLQIGPDLYLGPSGGVDDLVNHSCDPNCYLSISRHFPPRLISIREISPKEELTFDYSLSQLDPWDGFECKCNQPNCRRVIQHYATLPPAIKQRETTLGRVPYYLLNSGDVMTNKYCPEICGICKNCELADRELKELDNIYSTIPPDANIWRDMLKTDPYEEPLADFENIE